MAEPHDRREPQARGAGGSCARRRACAAASSAISVSALASTTMSPGVWARSTAADPSAIVPGSVASRCIQPPNAPSADVDRGAVEALAADHDEPRRARLAGSQGRSKCCCDAVADRLHDLAAVAAGHVDETLDPQHVVRPDRGAQPGAKRGGVGYRPAVDDKAVEIVVIVLAFELVQRGAGGEIVLGRGGEPERHRRRHPALRAR